MNAVTESQLKSIAAALEQAAVGGALQATLQCLMAKSDAEYMLGLGMEAVCTALAAERLVLCHPELPTEHQVMVRLSLARLYRNVLFDSPSSGRFLSRAYHILLRQEAVSLLALVEVLLHQSDWHMDQRIGDGVALGCVFKAEDALNLLPAETEREHGGRPVAYWRARCKVQRLWIQVMGEVRTGDDCDFDTQLATSIDEDFWAMMAYQDLMAWVRQCPELAFRFAYIEAWLGYDIVYKEASHFVGWEKQLFWRALCRPPGQVQVSLPLCLNLEEVPVGASRIPLLMELGVQAMGRAST